MWRSESWVGGSVRSARTSASVTQHQHTTSTTQLTHAAASSDAAQGRESAHRSAAPRSPRLWRPSLHPAAHLESVGGVTSTPCRGAATRYIKHAPLKLSSINDALSLKCPGLTRTQRRRQTTSCQLYHIKRLQKWKAEPGWQRACESLNHQPAARYNVRCNDIGQRVQVEALSDDDVLFGRQHQHLHAVCGCLRHEAMQHSQRARDSCDSDKHVTALMMAGMLLLLLL